MAPMCSFIAFASKCRPDVSFFKFVDIVEISIRTVPCEEIISKPVLSGANKTSRNNIKFSKHEYHKKKTIE
jgi:hypothetical protein